MSRWYVVWSLSQGWIGGFREFFLLLGSLWECIRGLLFIWKPTVLSSMRFKWPWRAFAGLMSIIGIRPWSSLARLICDGFPWSLFAKICAFQQGLSKAAGWGDGLWSESLSYSERSWIHPLPTCPSLTPLILLSTSPPGSPLRNCQLCTFLALNALLFDLHSRYKSSYYKEEHYHFPIARHSALLWYSEKVYDSTIECLDLQN